MPKSWAMVTGWVVLAVVFLAVSVFYFTTTTSFLASSDGKHTKHAILFLLLAVLSLAAASFARPRPGTA
jgi:asparagine N-glycosylation enzyme membrane subunit Stt3